jgi:hypothetical protein
LDSKEPFARRDDEVIELTRYQQLGTVKIDGDTVTQQIGRGKTAEYSLAQLCYILRIPRCLPQPAAVRKSADVRRFRRAERDSHLGPIEVSLRDQSMSLARVAREFNTKGFRTLRGGEFTDGTVLALLRRVSEG